MSIATSVKDPVCGMNIEMANAAGQAEYKGQTEYFCSAACKGKFDLNPEQYAGTAAGMSKTGKGCCN